MQLEKKFGVIERVEMSKGISNDTTVDPNFTFFSSTSMRVLQGRKAYTTFYIKTHIYFIIETTNAFRFLLVYSFI